MKLQQRMFLQAVQFKQVIRAESGRIYQEHGNAFQGSVSRSEIAAAENAGYLQPYPHGGKVVLRLSEAGEQALADALAARAVAR